MIQLNRVYSKAKSDFAFGDKLLNTMNTMLICKVVAVDFDNQTVDLQPSIQLKIEDETSQTIILSRSGEEARVTDTNMAQILSVPICFPRAGNFMVTLPIQIGDTGMCIFSKFDISLWKQNGDVQPQGSIRRFDINDGVFIPFVPNAQNKISDYNSGALELRAGNDKITMAGDGKISTNCDIVINGKSFLSHTHSISVPSTPYTGSTSTPS